MLNLRNGMQKLSLLCSLIILFFPHKVAAQDRTVDYRYAPAYYHTPIGFPDDWQKTMVNEKGALLYDFGPGPYVRANTVIGVGVKGDTLRPIAQRLEEASVPIVITSLSGATSKITTESFAIVPQASHTAKTSAKKLNVHRILGLNGALAWAKPEGKIDPAFRNVAWGTNRPIVYKIAVQRGSKKKVALGVCESYRTTPTLRMMEFHVEGAPLRTVDPLIDGTRNQPLVFLFDAQDVDRDGQLLIETRPSAQSKDPNVILNAIWVFPAGLNVATEAVVSGAATKSAEVYVDCGKEPEVQELPTRVDAMLTAFDNPSSTPLITVQSPRLLSFNSKSGVLEYEGRPFLASRPIAVTAHQMETGWELELPYGTRTAEITVIHGYRLPTTISQVPNLKEERERSVQWWKNEKRIPRGRVLLPDREMQHLFDASVRTLYQNRDIVDGSPQFQPGSTVYRGLWLHDGAYYIEAAAILGDTMSARLATEELFQFQKPNGQVQVMWPVEMQRETPMLVWTMGRYARIANNRPWLEAHWHNVTAAMSYIHQMRQQTMVDRSAPYYGLMPPGFVDGGISGLTADYSTVYWSLVGIREAVEMARWLGKSNEQRQWQTLYDDLFQSFQQAAKRDQRRDRFGNLYLPVRVGDTTTTDAPQRAQWAICEAIYLAPIFSQNDPLANGTLAVIDSTCIQGLPSSFGWMTGGIGVWFAPLYGLAHFAQGHIDRAVDVLYAFANHSTPHGAWAEEQMPKGVSSRTTGDYPTTSATAAMLRSVIFYLVYERGNTLELLRGLPAEWLAPGSTVQVKDLLTKFGRVSLEASVSKDGRTGRIALNTGAHGDTDDSMSQYTDTMNELVLSLNAFKRLGFVGNDGKELPDQLPLSWNRNVVLEVKKP